MERAVIQLGSSCPASNSSSHYTNGQVAMGPWVRKIPDHFFFRTQLKKNPNNYLKAVVNAEVGEVKHLGQDRGGDEDAPAAGRAEDAEGRAANLGKEKLHNVKRKCLQSVKRTLNLASKATV